VNLANTLNLIVQHLNEWKEQLAFTDDQKTILQNMLEAVLIELDKTKNETPGKVKYVAILEQLIDCLSQLV